MSVLQWLLDQLQRAYAYLIGLTDEVVANVIAAGIVALLGVVWAWLAVRLFKRKRQEREPGTFDEAFLRRQRKAMLDVVERQWIEGRLERSLHHQAPIFLGLTDTPEAVDRPWEIEIQTPGQPPRRTRDTGEILDVFDACGSLLILGAPGSGKTVTLLDLARQLIERARHDENAPLPVVFALASWAKQKNPLDDWMVTEMERQYRVPSTLGRHWVERHEVLPLLDGLDEVEESARAACVEAINAYRPGAVGGAPMVVCSREAEYAQLSTRLKVEAATALQPLQDQQVRQHLRRYGKKTAMLARMLSANEQLRELARTPLWLDVMAVAYGGDDTTVTLKAVTTGDIFNAYVRRVLLEHRRPLQKWLPRQSMHWLRWLAQQLDRTEQTLFRMEEMQPDWLETDAMQKRYRRWLRWGTAGLAALILGAGIGLIFRSIGGLVFGLVFALEMELVNRLDEGSEGHFIAPVTGLAWDRRRALWGLGLGLLMGLALGSLTVAIQVLARAWNPNFIWLLVMDVGIGLVIGLMLCFALGLQPVREIGLTTLPNQGTWQSAGWGLIFGLVLGLILGLTAGIIAGFIDGVVRGLVIGVAVGLIVGLLCTLGSPGGEAAIRHGMLRWRLWREGLTPKPWQHVAFLEEMRERLLLDRIGGTYRFKHDLLQKHVAQLDDGFISSLSSKPEL